MTDHRPTSTFLASRRRAARAAVLGVALVSAASSGGCSVLSSFQAKPDPTRFFVLAATAEATKVGSLAAGRSVGLGPIELPNYLQRPELIVRESPTEIRPSTFDRWSEPVDKGIARVLSQNLAAALGIDRVTLFPWYSNQEPTYQVRIDFLAFEPVGSGQARVVARWEARRTGAAAGPGVQRESAITRPIASDDGAASVAALSAALGELAREVASAVLSIDAGGATSAAPAPASIPRH